MLDNPRRLSTDKDIIVDRSTDIEGFIDKAGTVFPFIRVDEQIRNGSNDIEKKHFRFHFLSPGSGREITILPDVVFEDNPYPRTVEIPIRNSLMICDGDDLKVSVPDKNSILGDKLSAFAPHTTGIPFGKDKELEITKQLLDCWSLIQEMDDFKAVAEAYDRVSRIELGYRGLSITPDECLKDSIDSCICIMGIGSIRPEDYRYFSRGIGSLQGHVFSGRINGENAVRLASEVMYLSSCLLSGQEYERIEDPDQYRNVPLKVEGIRKISGFRNADPLAYAYMVRSLSLLQGIGMYTDSVVSE